MSAGCDPVGVDALDLLAPAAVAYLILFAIAAGDAIFPALPSESAAILAGVLAAIEPGIALPAVLAAAAAGAFVGDSTSYGLGRFGGRRAGRRHFSTGPTHAEESAGRACSSPSARRNNSHSRALYKSTGATYTSRSTAFPAGRFALYTGIAACLWALYAVLLGYGGRVFHERPLLAFAVAFGLAAGTRGARPYLRGAWSFVSVVVHTEPPMPNIFHVRPTQREKAEAFRALHEGEPFVIPNPWDAGSARVLEALGFKALATTSSGFAFTLGRLDGAATLDEVAEHARALDDATGLPVSIDLENGYGPQPEDAATRGRRTTEAGAVGGSIRLKPRGASTSPAMRSSVFTAAVEEAQRQHFPFTLTARARTTSAGTPISPTRSRGSSPSRRPTDVLYAPGLRSAEEVRAVQRGRREAGERARRPRPDHGGARRCRRSRPHQRRRKPHLGRLERDGYGGQGDPQAQRRLRGACRARSRRRVCVSAQAVSGEVLPIGRDELRAKMENGEEFVLVDALAPMSYARSHLPGAINLPLEWVDERAHRSRARHGDRRLLHRRGVHQLRPGRRALRHLGYSNVRHYVEGKTDWTGAGLPLRAVRSFSNDQAERHARFHPGLERGGQPRRGAAQLRRELPDADILVVDDGSTDRTPHIAREQGADVLYVGENSGLRAAIAAGYGYAAEHRLRVLRPRRRRRSAPRRGAAEASSKSCAREEATWRSGSRYATASRNGFSRERYKTSPARRLGTEPIPRRSMRGRARPAVPRCDERDVRREREGDADPRAAVPRAAHPRWRPSSASTTKACALDEHPGRNAGRASGKSKLQGKKLPDSNRRPFLTMGSTSRPGSGAFAGNPSQRRFSRRQVGSSGAIFRFVCLWCGMVAGLAAAGVVCLPLVVGDAARVHEPQ